MFPMLTRSLPDCAYCLFLTINVYVLSASVYIPQTWYWFARLKQTEYVRSMLICSARPFSSLHKEGRVFNQVVQKAMTP